MAPVCCSDRTQNPANLRSGGRPLSDAKLAFQVGAGRLRDSKDEPVLTSTQGSFSEVVDAMPPHGAFVYSFPFYIQRFIGSLWVKWLGS